MLYRLHLTARLLALAGLIVAGHAAIVGLKMVLGATRLLLWSALAIQTRRLGPPRRDAAPLAALPLPTACGPA